MKPSGMIADFDSAASMVKAIGRFLHGKDFPTLGILPKAATGLAEPVLRGVNALPQSIKENIYSLGGWAEAIPPRKLRNIEADELQRWILHFYPRRQYPAALLGSSGGGVVHLACAMGVPWLPQTLLIPVRRRGVHPDEPRQDLAWGQQHAHNLLQNNPQLQLHHMHDPCQDRLMVRYMSYFRAKWLRLGRPYKQFLRSHLAPGGTIFVTDCRLRWPVKQAGQRYYFQHGALGGATVDEFMHGSERVADFLQRYGSYRTSWDPPETDCEMPEAEWGFEPTMMQDIVRFARQHGYRVQRIIYDDPADLSPMVADLYRTWYRERNLLANRLVVETFALLEPWWTLRTGSVPFWMTFNKDSSAKRLRDYLSTREAFDEIGMMMFSHGADSVGLVSIAQWKELLSFARERGFFIGVDESKYPRDFAVFVRYQRDFEKKVSARYPMPTPLHPQTFKNFLDRWGEKETLHWEQVSV